MTKQSEYFKKIYCKDELPKKAGEYVTPTGLHWFSGQSWYRQYPYVIEYQMKNLTYWLKPIPSQPVLSFEEFCEKYFPAANTINGKAKHGKYLDSHYRVYLEGCNQSLPPLQGDVKELLNKLHESAQISIRECYAGNDNDQKMWADVISQIQLIMKLQSPKPVEGDIRKEAILEIVDALLSKYNFTKK